MNNEAQTGKRKRFLLTIATLLIAGVVYYYYCQDEYDRFFSKDSAFRVQNRSTPSDIDCQIKLNWQIAAKQMYHLDIVKIDQTYPSALEGQVGDKDNYALQIHMEISCTMNIRIFGKSGSEDFVYMGCQLSNVNVRAGDTTDTLSRDEDLEAIYRPFFLVAMHANGLPEKFYFPPHLDNQSRISLSEIIYVLQTVVPSNENQVKKKKWRSQEQHAFGKYKVEYMLEPHSCQALIKQNIRCIVLNDLDHTIFKTEHFQFRGIIEHSNHQITLSSDGASWIESYAGEETFSIFVSQHAVWYRRQTKILLTPDRQQLDSELFIWETDMSVDDIIDSFSRNENEKKRLSQNKKNQHSERMALSSQLELFQKDILENVSQDVILDHIRALKQFLTKFPEEAEFIPDLIKNLNIQERTAENIILILEMIGHEEAQGAISNIFLDYNQSPDIRLKAAVSAGGIASPKPILIDRLFQLISQEQESTDIQGMNRSDAAILSLGLINQTLYRANNSVAANFIHNRLIVLLQKHSDEHHMTVCIKALGNASMPEGLDYLLPYIDSDSPLIRKSAIQAIGKLDTPLNESDEFSENEKESLSESEMASPDALTGNVSARLINQYYVEDDLEIRQEIIKAITSRNDPGVAHLLDDILQEETDQRILDMIQSYFESYLQMN